MVIPSAVMTAMFLTACSIGFALGLIYDVFSFIRVKTKMSALFAVIPDIIFSLVCAASIICFTVAICEGNMRIYNMIGIALGAFVYSRISRSVKMLTSRAYKKLKNK